MKNKIFRKISILILTVFIIGLIPNSVVVKAEVEDKELKNYEIYPIPQDIQYTGGVVTIPNEVNVVYKSEIDDSTKDHLMKTLNLFNTNVVISNTEDVEKFNIVLGLSNEDTLGYTPKTENLFDKYDSYVLEISDNSIKIIGNDMDAIYCGVTTLMLMIEQSTENELLKSVVEDYSDIQYRGYIEGYYGIPWSNEEMISLMEFGSRTKLNTFIFVPKDDPYHNSKWREPYPADKLAEMAEVIEAGTRTKNRFVYAIHPFMNNGINKENYDQEMQYIIDKFETLYDLGVRQFSLLADDAVSETALQIKATNTLTDWLDSKEGTYPLIFCPQAYSGWPSAGYYNQFRDGTKITIGGEEEVVPAVKEDVEIMHTGPAIIGNVDDNLNQGFKDVSGRYPYMWLNWPVNDYTDSSLFIGKAEMLKKSDKLNGLVSNPMCEAELSKIGLFQVADYSWNVDDFDVDNSWDASFKNVDASVEEELRIVSRHMSYPRDGVYHTTGLVWEESEDLKEPIDALKEKLEKGEDATEEAKILKVKLEEIIDAANSLIENSKNEGLKKEFAPYRQSIVATLEASIAGLNTIMAIGEEEYDIAWNEYSNIATNIKESNSVTKPGYKPGGYTNLEVKPGTKRLRPLAEYLNKKLGKELNKILGLEGAEVKPYYEFKDWKNISDNEIGKYIDGDLSTYTSLEYGGMIREGDYYGVDLGDVKDIKNISILQGSADKDLNVFHHARLEYSKDGENWTTIEDYSDGSCPNNINIDSNISARYVRLITTKQGFNGKPDYWLHVREVSVEVEDGIKIVSNLEDLSDVNLDVNGSNIALNMNGTTLNRNEFVAIQLENLEKVQINNGELPEGIVIEGSENFKYWKEIDKNEDSSNIIRYIRIKNTSDNAVQINDILNIDIEKINEPKVTVGSYEGVADANRPNNNGSSESIFTIDGLEPGNHKITIFTEASGLNSNVNKSSIDKFVIKNGEEDTEVNISASTEGLTLLSDNSSIQWKSYSPKAGWLNNDEMYLVDSTGIIEYEFTGTGIELYGAYGPYMCRYDYYVDGISYDDTLNNVFDGADSTQGYYKTDKVTIDMGQVVNLNSVEVKVAENIANETPNLVLGSGKVQVSLDGSTWTDIRNFDIQGNNTDENGFDIHQAPYYWMDIKLSGEPEYRYIRLALDEEKEFLINEISINGGQKLLSKNVYEISTTENIADNNIVSNLLDKKLDTHFTIHETNESGYLSYKLTDKDYVSTISIIQNANTISNAIVEVLASGDWKSVGLLSNSINVFDVSMYNNVTEVRIKYESVPVDFQLIEITYVTDSITSTPIDRSELESKIKEVEGMDLTKYTEETVAKLNVALDNAKSIFEKEDATQAEVNEATTELQNAIAGLVNAEIVVSKVNNLKAQNTAKTSTELTWEKPDNTVGLVGYVIYKDGKLLTEINAENTSYKVEGLRTNTIYGFKVTAKYSNGAESKPKSVNVRTTKK